MVITTFNIEEGIMNEFRKNNKGDMSKIVETFLSNYLKMGEKSSEEIIQMQRELDELERKVKQINEQRSLLLLKLEEVKIAQTQKEKERASENSALNEWVNFMISDAKTQKRYTDLVYTSEKEGYPNVRAYLEEEYYKRKV